jgi:hypothetical protein
VGGWLLRPGLYRLGRDVEQRQPVVFYQGADVGKLEAQLVPHQIGVPAKDAHLAEG